MEFGKAFSFFTGDEDWIKKLLIAAVLCLTGIGAIPVLGWAMAIIKRMGEGEVTELPDWSDFGGYIVAGLKHIAGVLVLILPGIIVSGIIAGVGAIFPAVLNDYDTANILMMICVSCGSLLMVVYAIAVSLLALPMLGQFSEGKSFGEAINPGKNFALFKANIGGFLLAGILGSIIASLITSISSIACGIGIFAGQAYSQAVIGHLVGQAYWSAKASIADAPVDFDIPAAS